MAKQISKRIQEDLQRNLAEGTDYIPTGIFTQYKEPDDFDLKKFRQCAAAFFKRVTMVYDTDREAMLNNADQLSRKDTLTDVEPLSEKSGKQDVKLNTSDVTCVQTIAASKNIYGASLAFQNLKERNESFSLQLVYEVPTHMFYESADFTDGDSESRNIVAHVLLPMMWESEGDDALIPNSVDGIGKPIFLPGDLSDSDAKHEIDRILNKKFESTLPYAFFTKMLGYAFPLSNLALGNDKEDIENQLVCLRGLAHPIMIENRDLAVYISTLLRQRRFPDLKLPAADSGFSLITWPQCDDGFAIIRTDDCKNEGSNTASPMELQVAQCAMDMLSYKYANQKHLTMSNAVQAEKAEKEAQESAIRSSDLYKALQAENEKLKSELEAKKDLVPADDHKQKGLEDKCEELRVANGQMKLRIDALEAKNKALREKKASSKTDFAMHTDGITEMYDDEIYLQIMALLSDALPNLRTSGATRRMEIVQALLKANNYDGQMDKIHSDIVKAARTGRKEDLYSVLADYNIAVDDKEHPAFHFNGESAAIDNMSGTPSDVHSAINAAKHIGKTFF